MKENEIYEINDDNYLLRKTVFQSNLNIDDYFEDKYKNELNSPNEFEEELKNFNSIKKIEKIVCPQCGKIPILEIDPKNYIIQSFCPEMHTIKEKLVNYILESNEKSEKSTESIKCSSCNKTNIELKIDKKNMYLCNCKKSFCEKCKQKHEEKEDNEISHNLIKHSDIDFHCFCSGEFSEYTCYCLNCNQNLCQNCLPEHKSKNIGHDIIYFTDEVDKFLTEEEINKKKEELSKQEKNINDFLKNLEKWEKLFALKIKHLKENLKLLVETNKYLIYSFDISTSNQQTIETTKKLNFSYNQFINYFNKTENNNIINDEKDNINEKNNYFEQQYGYILGLLNYQKDFILTKKEKKYSKKIKIEDLSAIKNKHQIEAKIESKITSVCQLDEDLLVGDEKGLVHLYKLDNNLTKILTIRDNSGKEINYLYSLKNRYFISSNENEIKIIKINKTENMIQYNIYQSFQYDYGIIDLNKTMKLTTNLNISGVFDKPMHARHKGLKNIYYQILSLINGNIIYIYKDNLMRLEPFLDNYYKRKELNDISIGNIISIAEINENKFCVYSENNEIIIFDSNTFLQKGKNIKVNIGKDKFIKIESINNSMFAGLGKRKIYIISLYKGNDIKIIKTVDTQMNNIDIKIAVEPYKILIAGFHKNNNYINQYNFELTKDSVTSSKNDSITSTTRVNMIFLYKDKNDNYAKLVYIHNNNCIKIYADNNNN